MKDWQGVLLISVLIAAIAAVWFVPWMDELATQDKTEAAERQPAGVWIEFEGKAYPVRIIESIRDWPQNEPAPPPACSLTDPRWQGTSRVEDGYLVLEPPEILRREGNNP